MPNSTLSGGTLASTFKKRGIKDQELKYEKTSTSVPDT